MPWWTSKTQPLLRRVLGTGLAFTVILFAVEVWLGHAVAFLFITGWLAVALFETWNLLRASLEVYPRRRRPYRPDIKWVRVGKGALALYHRPQTRDIPILRQEGATHIVTLLSEKENALKYGHLTERHGLTWIWLPMPNANLPRRRSGRATTDCPARALPPARRRSAHGDSLLRGRPPHRHGGLRLASLARLFTAPRAFCLFLTPAVYCKVPLSFE